MKNTIIAIIVFATPTINIAQKHDAHWIVSSKSEDGLIITFGQNNPHFEPFPLPFQSNATTFTFCDSLGNLLMHTNGFHAISKIGSRMDKGDTLMSDFKIPYAGMSEAAFLKTGYGYTHSNAIVYKPGSNQLLWLFQWSRPENGATKLVMSEIDIKANNGLGRVLKKDQLLLIGHFIDFRMVKHTNGRDWWILLCGSPTNTYTGYGSMLVSPMGIAAPVWYEFPPPPKAIVDPPPFSTAPPYSAISLDGSLYAVYIGLWDGPFTLDFDRCTGAFSNFKFHQLPPHSGIWVTNGVDSTEQNAGGTVCISPNKKYLNIVRHGLNQQIDLVESEAQGNTVADTIFDARGIGNLGMTLGPDGRIYFRGGDNIGGVWPPKSSYSTIEYPNKKGKSSKPYFEKIRIWLSTGMQPGQTQNSPNYRLGPIDGSPCDTLGFDNHPLCDWRWAIDDSSAATIRTVTFTDNSFYEPQTWHWDFGDGTTSQDTSPIHIFPANGLYHVCLTVCNQFSCDSICQWVNIGQVSTVEEAIIEKNRVFISPNPSSGSGFQLRSTNGSIEKVVVFDLLGHTFQPLFSKGIAVEVVFEKALPSGPYFIQTTFSNGATDIQKWIVQSN